MRMSFLPLLASAAFLASPVLAKDFILAPARPDKLIVVDAEEMKVVNTITVQDAGPTPMVPIVAPDGKFAYSTVNKTESFVKIDLDSGEAVARVDLSSDGERVKSLFGFALSPDGGTLAVYESPVKMELTHFEVQPTRIALYDTETMERKSSFEAPRQITILAYSTDGTRIYGLGRSMHVMDAVSGELIEDLPIQSWQPETYSQPDVLAVWSQHESSDVLSVPFYTALTAKDPADPEAYRTGMLTMDLDSGEMDMREVRIMDVFYFSTAVSPDKTRAFGAYNVLESFDLQEDKSIKRVPLPHSYYSVNVSTDGDTVWLGGALGDLAAYDSETLEKKGQVDLPGNASMSLASVRLFSRGD
ncbi:quinohemoprotein amine dehydrogenase subunit beta [Paracoccus sp. Z330]|uniref:Quinohemoprotein amine dehydrogenase subunit beta n=1 Tax=Paracoccus onchidii TaxID=3017813 RepID=A0ABT4ZA81_9RHOB|nr:quinohemoprotein amine dehydrogenase subunit beta [Paracoccus onchidii]MDB6176261.1 quinohemoprotein amine dehydrogenase subunit beta [Paracoccus onchidii]